MTVPSASCPGAEWQDWRLVGGWASKRWELCGDTNIKDGEGLSACDAGRSWTGW